MTCAGASAGDPATGTTSWQSTNWESHSACALGDSYVMKVTFEEDVEFQIHSAKSKYVDQEPFDGPLDCLSA